MATYIIDPVHSEITFKVKHLMIANITGNFTRFEGKLESSKDDFSDAQINFTADIDSINTNNEQRDGHLKSDVFFDSALYPKVSFQSASFDKISDDNYKLNGNLTMHGITKPVTLSAELGGASNDMYGQSKIGFEISGKINRKDFGLEWNAALETGGVVLSDEVKLLINVQLVKHA